MVAASFEHADDTRAALREIVAEHGAATLSNPSAMSNLLKDLLPDAPGVARLLVAAAEDRVVERLREQLAQGLDASTATRLTASAFAQTTMVAPQACAWIVDEIASVTGMLPGLAGDVGPGAAAPPSSLSDAAAAPTIAGRFPPGQATPTPVQSGASAAVPATADTTPVASAPPTVTTADGSAPGGTSADATAEVSPATGGPRQRKRGLLIGMVAAVVVLGAVIGLVVAAPWASSPTAQPVSAALLTGLWTTHYKVVTLSGSDTTYLVGKQWADTWSFTSECGSGPCTVRLSGVISGPGNSSATHFQVGLTRGGASYTGSVKLRDFESCTVGKKQYPDVSTISFRIKVVRAKMTNNTWLATFWTGTMVNFIPRHPVGSVSCSADRWTTAISGTP